MPRDLFGDVTDPSVKVGSRKWYTVPVSLAFHTVAVLIVFIVPLMATGALPVPHDAVIFVPVALAPLPAPPPVHRADAPKPAVNKHAAPIETPDTIASEPEFDIEIADPAASGLHEMGIVEGGTALIAATATASRQDRHTDSSWWRYQATRKDSRCRSDLPADCASGSCAGNSDHRSRDWCRGPRSGRARFAIRAASRRGGTRGGPSVALHTHTTQRTTSLGRDDRDGEVSVAVGPLTREGRLRRKAAPQKAAPAARKGYADGLPVASDR